MYLFISLIDHYQNIVMGMGIPVMDNNFIQHVIIE
jgi:hypothetical protein